MQHNCKKTDIKKQFAGLHADFMGFGITLLCSIHCAVLPILLSFTPLAGTGRHINTWFEVFIFLITFIVGVYTLVHGFRDHHKNPLAIILFLIGYNLIVGGIFFLRNGIQLL